MLKIIKYISLVVIIILLHSAFYYFTNFIQEDSFITWRCAEVLAETGVYGFNLNEKVSASTTHLYVFICAFFKLVAGKYFINVVFSFNVFALLAGLYLVAGSVFEDSNKKTALWVLLSVSPNAFLVSASGMETSLLIFLIGLISYSLRYGKDLSAGIGLALLPWVRLDSVAIGLIVVGVYSFKHRRVLYFPLLLLLLGVASLLVFNYSYFGAFLNQTIIAKRVAYKSDYSLTRIFRSMYYLIAYKGGIYAPFKISIFDKMNAGILFFVGTLGICLYYLWKIRDNKNKFIALVLLFIIGTAIPGLYAFGGVLFPWYTWPSSIAAFAIVYVFIIETFIIKDQKLLPVRLVSLTTSVLILCVGQWLVCLDVGTYEMYRKNIGLFLKSTTENSATVLLEPAGYIPYYSQRYTYDEIGLVSPIVTEYRKQYGYKWFVKFLQEKTPTYLVEREHIQRFVTLDGYSMTDDEKQWFMQNYELKQVFPYNVRHYHSNPLIIKLLDRPNLASFDTFYLYKLKQ